MSFTLNDGELVQLEGRNGVGKTSLLRILAGLSRPEQGDVLWQQQSIYQHPEVYHQSMLYIGHKPGLKDVLTPYENLLFYQQATVPEMSKETIHTALEKMGLRGREDIPVKQLSAGQQRRVILARLYLNQAKVWLLDEPFTAIDKQGVANLLALFKSHCANGGIILFTSHQSAEDDSIRHISIHNNTLSAS